MEIPHIVGKKQSEYNYMNGIDVSQWQGNIDFSAVRDAGIELVYIKATEGTDFVCPFFTRNYENAKAEGLMTGFYHYLTARSAGAARQEAYHFVSVTKGLTSEGKPVMDIEDLAGLTGEEIREIALAFLQAVEEFSSKTPAIYADAYNASAYFTEEFTAWPLWIAQYHVTRPDTDNPWETWVGWQFTDRGAVAGIQGNVDRDVFREGILNAQSDPIEITAERPEAGVSDITYTVKPGDTLSGIARKYHVQLGEILSENEIQNPDLIYPGQRITIKIQDDRKHSDIYHLYTVEPGDTLSGIARRYGTTLGALVRVNGLPDPNLIYPGQIIKIER